MGGVTAGTRTIWASDDWWKCSDGSALCFLVLFRLYLISGLA